MGKGGSRYGAGRPAIRPQVESYRHLDIRRMVKAGCIKSGHCFGWYWRNDVGETMANVSCKVADYVEAKHAVLTVSYRWHYGGAKEWRSVEKHVPLTTTPCHFGGQRHWFNCPCCHHRAAVLFIMGDFVRCPKCARVSYASQRGDEIDRLWIKQRKIEARLGANHRKPKRMRVKTWERLRAQFWAFEEKREEALEVAWNRLKKWL